MNENKSHVKAAISSEKNFGIVFAIVFILIALYPLILGLSVRLWSLIVSLIFFVFAFTYPNIFIIPNKLWHKFGLLLGGIIAPVIMALVYIIIFIPIGLTFKIRRKDLLNEKLDKKSKSYWIIRKEPVGSMKNQF